MGTGVETRRYVIAYDIADDKRRSRIVNELKSVGYRVQYSIFEAELTAQSLVELRMRIGRWMRASEDSVIYYVHCARCQDQVIRDGKTGSPLDDEDRYFL